MSHMSMNYDTRNACAAVGSNLDDLKVEYDGICYVDIGVKGDDGEHIALFIYADVIPALIERLAVEYGKALHDRGRKGL